MEKALEIVRKHIHSLYSLYVKNNYYSQTFENFEYNLTVSIQRCSARIIQPIFIFNNVQEITGFCVCCFDEKIQLVKESSAYFFNLIISNDETTILKLRKVLNQFTKNHGTHQIIGPIHESVIFSRGIRTFKSDLYFFGLPTNDANLSKLFEKAGFEKEQDMIEIVFTKIQLKEKIIDLSNYLKGGLKKIKIDIINGKVIKDRSEEIEKFYNEQWNNNWSFFPIKKADIQIFFDSIPEEDNHAVFVYCENKLIGFCMMLEEQNKFGLKSARVYFIGTDRNYRNTGLVIPMLIEGIKLVDHKKIELISCAWMLESNFLVLNLIQKFIKFNTMEKRIYRIYKLN